MTIEQTTQRRTIVLSPDLAPSLNDRVLRLLDEVSPNTVPELAVEVRTVRRSVVCHEGGTLGGHHAADGRIQWIHRSCHRRLHRSGRYDLGLLPSHRRRQLDC